MRSTTPVRDRQPSQQCPECLADCIRRCHGPVRQWCRGGGADQRDLCRAECAVQHRSEIGTQANNALNASPTAYGAATGPSGSGAGAAVQTSATYAVLNAQYNTGPRSEPKPTMP